MIPTASQTIGPYWHLLADPAWADLTRFGANGRRISFGGQVRDGAGELVTDACIELWQCDPAFSGFGRCATDGEGRFSFTTVRPDGGPHAPHLAIGVFARGLLQRVATRAYFDGDPRNDADPVLAAVDPARRATLLATEARPGEWSLDIRLQGEGETVFMES